MNLLDLPPELFQQVAHEVVESVGISSAWKLRQICRTFADGIGYEVLGKRSVSAFPSWIDRLFLGHHVDLYLATRLQLPLDTNPGLLAKLQSIVEWVVEEMDITDSKRRMQIAGEICASLKQSVGGHRLVDAIQGGNSDCYAEWYKWSQLALDIHDKLYAALVIGSYNLV
jgi:hypothetical protein